MPREQLWQLIIQGKKCGDAGLKKEEAAGSLAMRQMTKKPRDE